VASSMLLAPCYFHSGPVVLLSRSLVVRRATASPLTSHASALDAFLLLIRPFELDRVTDHLLEVPRANVTDFSIGIVIPT